MIVCQFLTDNVVIFVPRRSVSVHLVENVYQMNVTTEQSHTEEIKQHNDASGH